MISNYESEVEQLAKIHKIYDPVPPQSREPFLSREQEHIKTLEAAARRGDLIAFHEWKKLTNNDIVRVEIVAVTKADGKPGMLPVKVCSFNPDIQFESSSFGIGFGF
jgi:hypothetical protein